MMQYAAIFFSCKTDTFHLRNIDIFLIISLKYRPLVLAITAAGVVPCGGSKKSPIVQITYTSLFVL